MITLRPLLLVLGLVCFLMAAFRVPASSHVDLTAAGLALMAAALIL